MLKKILGMKPTPTEDGAYEPSPTALKLATQNKTDYDDSEYRLRYQGNKKVLMVCTEEQFMTMKNGKKFSTGNHPVEMFVPLLHLQKAGFDVDIATPTGQPVQIEQWAMPEKDEAVKSIYDDYRSQLDQPLSLHNFVSHKMAKSNDYLAVFFPGGHGAMLGLPQNEDVGQLIEWVTKKDLFVFAICHGPAALLAADKTGRKKDFVYKGYKMAAFPDSVDSKTPTVGYLPGPMPWKFGKKLKKLGVKVVNKKADNTCQKDRKLITAASPLAANDFGKLITKALLKNSL
ncbi:glyoxalase III HchA [Psychrobacter pygoscelis]|uniref:glyoxalase III HchA n=1 Tax=Psychrobacter pygoscelis TaxID=2488563 RepID=UPI00103A8276|nr:glyoxalase III HchA [Psychrobacter pygoscelis]